ncbi:MAG TPA: response regulator transcription factor [Candidatus Sulfotelmatobacter sp.]|nr:response regulator transcription factor [Candidatus Sulfotelmatobacter sp.]
MNKSKIKIFLVDDHPLVREWLTNLIHQQPDLFVCGESEDAPHALQEISVIRPNVAIVDISLKHGSGIELIKSIKAMHPEVATIVLSMHDERLYAERALRAGARGYIMKRETAKKVITAIRQVLAGKIYMSETLAAVFAEKFVDGKLPPGGSLVEKLSDRELETFQLLGKGYETRQVAEMMNVSMKTVQAHCAHIKEKLKLTNAAELLREAVRWQENNLGG